MNALAPIVYRAPRIRSWRAGGGVACEVALAARTFAPSRARARRRVSTRWLLPGGGRRILVVTYHRGAFFGRGLR